MGQVLKLDPKRANARHGLGFVGGGRVNGRDYSEKECYLQVLTLDPKRAMAWNNVGHYSAQEGRLEEAVDQYRRALDIESSHDYARVNLVGALTDMGRHDDAAVERPQIALLEGY